jgi:hypothetical protein
MSLGKTADFAHVRQRIQTNRGEQDQRRLQVKQILIGIFAGMLLAGIAPAQTSTQPANRQATGQIAPPSPQAETSVKIAPGSVIPVRLTKMIDSKKLQTGEEVDAKVTQDMKAQDGQVIVAKDTEVVGHVTEAQPRTKQQKESQVGINFDQAIMKDGRKLNFPMTIQAIVAPPSLNPGNESRGQPTSAPVAGMPRNNTAPGPGGIGSPTSSPDGATPTGEWPTGTTSGNAGPQITGNTEGVVGYSHLKLSTATNGSVISSEKGNVKLDSGTLLLLRVS